MENYTGSYDEIQSDPYTVTPVKETIIVTYLTLFPICLFGNLLVIYVIIRNRKLRTVTNFFLGNLAFADLLVSLFCIIPKMMVFVMESWPLGLFVCALHNYFMSVVTKASIFTLTLISFERYFAIIHPFRVRHLLTIKKLAIATGLLWIASLSLSIPVYFMYDVNHYEGKEFCFVTHNMSRHWLILHDSFVTVVCFLLPLLLMLIFYSKIIRKLWCGLNVLNVTTWINDPVLSTPRVRFQTRFSFQTEITYHENPPNAGNYETNMINVGNRETTATNGTREENNNLLGPHGFILGGDVAMANLRRSSEASSEDRTPPIPAAVPNLERHRKSNMYQRNHTRKKVVRMLIAIVISFVICMFPLQLIFVLEMFETYPFNTTWGELFFPFAYAMYFLNSCINPIIYAILSSNFRSKMKETLICNTTHVQASVYSPEQSRKRSLSEGPMSV